MAFISPDNVQIRKAGNLLRINLGGKSFELHPKDAVHLGYAISNAAADMLPTPDGFPEVTGVMLKPYEAGDAILTLLAGNMPFAVKIGHNHLNALAAAAQAALEHAEIAGKG